MKAGKLISTLLSAVVLLVLLGDMLLIFAPRLLGYGCYAVSSGSMEPTVKKGGLVFTKEVALAEIQPGDILTFRDKKGKSFFTHRVTQVDAETGIMATKGDANQFGDPAPASYDYAVGRVVKTVPFFGWLHLCLTAPYGLAGVLALIIVWLGTEIYFVRKRKHEKA